MNESKLQSLVFVTALVFLGIHGQTSTFAVGTSSEWLTAVDGSWADASNWSTDPFFPKNDFPNFGDEYDALINAVGNPYTVVLSESVAVKSLTLNSVDAKFQLIDGRLETDLIDLQQGTLLLEGEVVGATITTSTDGILEMAGGRRPIAVLDNVNLDADLFVPPTGGSPDGDRLALRNGLFIADGRELSLLGVVRIDGSQAIQGQGEILAGGTVRLSENTSLTIGSNISLRATNNGASIGSPRGTGIAAPNIALVNKGFLSADGNQNALNLMNVSTVNGAVFENQGVVQVLDNSRVIIGGDWTNTGVLRIRDNGALSLGGEFSVDDLGTIDRQGGQLYISGQVDNVGKTFVASAETGDLILGRAGVFIAGPTQIRGGVLDSTDGATWTFQNGELFDVTLSANVALGVHNSIDVRGDLSLDDAVISLSSNTSSIGGAVINFRDLETPQAINGNGMIQFTEGRVNRLFVGKELSIGSEVVIESLSGTGELRNGRVINNGRIHSGVGSSFNLAVEEFVNRADIEIDGRLTIGRDRNSSWTNEGTIRIRAFNNCVFRTHHGRTSLRHLLG